MNVNKSIVILKRLLADLPAKIGDYNYRLDDNNELCVEGYRYIDGEVLPWDGLLLKVDFTLGQFIRMCEKLTDEEVFLMGANSALTKINNMGGPTYMKRDEA